MGHAWRAWGFQCGQITAGDKTRPEINQKVKEQNGGSEIPDTQQKDKETSVFSFQCAFQPGPGRAALQGTASGLRDAEWQLTAALGSLSLPVVGWVVQASCCIGDTSVRKCSVSRQINILVSWLCGLIEIRGCNEHGGICYLLACHPVPHLFDLLRQFECCHPVS